MDIESILNYTIFNNTIKDYLEFILLFLGVSLIIFAFSKLLLKTLSKVQNKEKFDIKTILFIIKRLTPIFYVFAFLLSVESLKLNNYKTILHVIEKGILSISIIYVFILLVDVVRMEIFARSKLVDGEKNTLNIIFVSIKILIILFGSIFVIKNFIPTFEISSLLASVGVSGIIIGLALQKTLQDIFNYISLVLDKPYVEGDYILFDQYQGTVKKIGIRSTRLESLSGEEISVPNSVITSAIIKNYSRLTTRRVQILIHVPFETDKDKLKEIPSILKAAVESVEQTVFAFARFSNISDYSFDYTLAYYINEIDYNRYMELLEKVNLAIVEKLREFGVFITYPIEVVKLDNINKK